MGRPAKIDRDSVLDTALALADTSGLESVTMQRVAERLGVTPDGPLPLRRQQNRFFQSLPEQIDHVMVTGPGPYYAPLADAGPLRHNPETRGE